MDQGIISEKFNETTFTKNQGKEINVNNLQNPNIPRLKIIKEPTLAQNIIEKKEIIFRNCLGNDNCSMNAINGTLCEQCWEKLFEKTKINYPNFIVLVKSIHLLLQTNIYEKLFIKTHSHLIQYWDFNKTKNVDIKTVSYGSGKRINWKCDKNHESESTLANKTVNNKTKDGISCKKCSVISQITKGTEEEIIEQRLLSFEESKNVKKIGSIEIGDRTEEYVTDLLRNLNIYKNVEKLGHLGGNADICITHYDDSINYLQVKTIPKKNDKKDKCDNIYYQRAEKKINMMTTC